MKNRFAEIVILAEDERSANLFRRYVLRVFGINNRRIRQEISPSSQGDAKQWVLRQYPIEVKALRTMHRRTGLGVHLDADAVAERTRQLAAALKADKQDEREANDRISLVIPRRHTETWLSALSGVVVDEEQNCKRQRILPDFDGAVQQAALELFKATRANAPAPANPSLASAVPELRRLEI